LQDGVVVGIELAQQADGLLEPHDGAVELAEHRPHRRQVGQ
jgi:hypothetical protein